MLELLIDNIFVVWVVWWKCYLAYSRHSNVYKAYSFRGMVLLFVREILKKNEKTLV